MNWHRISLIASFDFRHSVLKSKGLFFLAPFLLFWGLILYNINDDIVSKLQSIEVFTAMSAWLNIDTAKKLLWEHPTILSAFLIISFMTAPAFMLLAGNNQFSSDLSSGYFRFLSTRCKRLEIFIGKYVSSLCLVIISLLLVGIYCLGLSAYYEEHSFSTVLTYFLEVIVVVILYHAALLTYTSIISAAIKSPLGSLLLGGVAYVGLLIFAAVANNMHGNTDIFSYVLPSTLKPFLLDINTTTSIWATLALPIYIIIYGFLAWTIFKHKDF